MVTSIILIISGAVSIVFALMDFAKGYWFVAELFFYDAVVILASLVRLAAGICGVVLRNKTDKMAPCLGLGIASIVLSAIYLVMMMYFKVMMGDTSSIAVQVFVVLWPIWFVCDVVRTRNNRIPAAPPVTFEAPDAQQDSYVVTVHEPDDREQ